MFLRKLRNTIPDISIKTNENVDEKAEQNDKKIKEKSKRCQDRTQHMQTRKIDIGVIRVIVKQQKRNELFTDIFAVPLCSYKWDREFDNSI